MVDLSVTLSATELDFYTDASRSQKRGMGGYFNKEFFAIKWEEGLIKLSEPSIGFLELYAACTGVFIWSEKLKNSRVVIFIDNDAAKQMINNQSSNCRFCMKLIRLLTLNCLTYNMRIFAKYVPSGDNEIADSLSRFEWSRFWRLAVKKGMDRVPQKIPAILWPPSKFFKD